MLQIEQCGLRPLAGRQRCASHLPRSRTAKKLPVFFPNTGTGADGDLTSTLANQTPTSDYGFSTARFDEGRRSRCMFRCSLTAALSCLVRR